MEERGKRAAEHARESDDGGEAVPTGNTYDKYNSQNPVVRWLMRQFRAAIFELLDRVEPRRVLDVGCGEGIVSEAIVERYPDVEVLGVDLEDPDLQAHWSQRGGGRLSFRTGRAEDLAFEDGAFDTVVAFEVLEHLRQPEAALAEMSRVAGEALVLSVPREPLWRVLNVLRGAYLSDLGNTPGHLNHWSRRGFAELVGEYGEVDQIRSPIPWTVLSADVRSGR